MRFTLQLLLLLLFLLICNQCTLFAPAAAATATAAAAVGGSDVAPEREICTLHEACRPCSTQEMERLVTICGETGHLQIVKCVREKQDAVDKKREEEEVVWREESCTPDIAYTKYTVPAVLIFQGSMLASLFICSVAFYRRKSYLASLQRMRYHRLVGETGPRAS